MKRATFNIHYYIKRTKLLKNGDAPVYMRLTLNGENAEISLKRRIKPSLWDTTRNKAKGTSPEASEVNDYLTSVRGQLHRFFHMWKLNTQALNGTPGIWTHVSFRADKSDCHPQLSLIKLLKSLSEER